LEIFYSTISFILSLVREAGYLGILIGMTIESSFFPFPSEIILIPAGALMAKGEMSFFPIFIASLTGSLLGATFNYLFAFLLGRTIVDLLLDKYGKFLFISRKNLEKTDSYFEKYGSITTFTGRLIPGIRQLISLPAGFAKMNFLRFILFTGLGAGIWTIILIYIGYFLGTNSEFIADNLNVLLIAILAIFLIIYFYYRKRKSH
jgi:membrane protein DedA with SNARE-associated domain